MIRLLTRLFRPARKPVIVHRVVNKPVNYSAAREAMTARLRGEVEAIKGKNMEIGK